MDLWSDPEHQIGTKWVGNSCRFCWRGRGGWDILVMLLEEPNQGEIVDGLDEGVALGSCPLRRGKIFGRWEIPGGDGTAKAGGKKS